MSTAVPLAGMRFGIEPLEDATQRGALTDWSMRKMRPMFVFNPWE